MGKGDGPFCLQAQRAGSSQSTPTKAQHKIHLVEKITRECSLCDQFKYGGGEGGLFHEDITFKLGATMICTETP